MEKKEIIEIGIKKIKRDLCTYPSFSRKDRFKRTIKNAMGRGEGNVDRFFWPHAMMVDALWNYYEKTGDQESLELITTYYQQHIGELDDIKYPDTVMNGYRLIALYEKTGKPEYKLAIEKMARYLLQAPKATDGSILYRANQSEQVYADTIGMIVPFLLRYGAMVGDSRYTELAIKQFDNFMLQGMDAPSGLPYHAYNATTKLKQGIIGWGRAVGWIMMGVASGIEYADNEVAEKMINALEQIIHNVINYQREDGLFSWQLQAIDGPADISGTGMILLALKSLLDIKYIDERYSAVIDKGMESIMKCGRYFDKCLAECEALGCYPQRYGEYPWGTAMIVGLMISCE